MKKSGGTIEYGIKFGDSSKIELIHSDEMTRKFEKKLLDFLQSKVMFTPVTESSHRNIIYGKDIDKMPLKITGSHHLETNSEKKIFIFFCSLACTNFGGGCLMYLCKFEGSHHEEIVVGRIAAEKYPKLVISFFESNLHLFESNCVGVYSK